MAKIAKLFWIHLSTPNFTFDAFGTSESNVKNLLKKAWKQHAKQTGAAADYIDFKDEVQVQEVEAGLVLRDGNALIDPKAVVPTCPTCGVENPIIAKGCTLCLAKKAHKKPHRRLWAHLSKTY